MRAVDIIMKKRGGGELSRDELRFLINGYVSGEVPEYQVSAWLMAVYFKGMTFRETADLTDLMLNSGRRMDLSEIKGPFVDKHSTGGVGDKVSLVLAPMVAACGVRVPMMSGRSLGHTGGTLDKLESIPGYRTGLSEREFGSILSDVGYAMTGQSREIVPADRLLYALRDVTATVESIPLITASILSKKAAEGADALVFDVKSGSGAFMKRFEDAERLANSLVQAGKAMGKRVVAVISDMSEPLGYKVGNFLEVEETIDCLRGTGPSDLMELTMRLGAWMLVAGGVADSIERGRSACAEALSSGRAYDRFLDNIRAQGGDAEKMLSLYGKFRSGYSRDVLTRRSGDIASIDAYKVGLASVLLGAGRSKADDAVFPDVGVVFERKKGSRVGAGDRVCTIFGKDAESLERALPLMEEAIVIGTAEEGDIILREISEL